MRWILLLALVASCDKKKESPEPPAAAAAAAQPAKDKAMDEDKDKDKPADADPFEIKLRKLGASDPITLDQAKQRLVHTIKDIVHEESTPDGYILTFSMATAENKMDADGRVYTDDSGVEYAVQVRRSIDGAPYKCSAIVQKRETLQRVIDACKAATATN